MRVLILTVIMTLPLMAFGQKGDQPQPQAPQAPQAPQQPQAPTNEAPATAEREAPATTEKEAPPQQATTTTKTERPAQEEATPNAKKTTEKATNERKQSDVKDRTVNKSDTKTRSDRTTTDERGRTDVEGRTGNRSETETRAGSSTSRTRVNAAEFRSRHSEVFKLGEHPKDYFVQRYGERDFRMIGDGYFVFVDGCWVSVHVHGSGYTQRVICEGDPEFIEVGE